MNKSVFEYLDYKYYLSEKITQLASEDKGLRRRLCEYVQCQTSYLSQVLNGQPDFTLEQAMRLNQFLLHDSSESRFFICLVEKSRAGSVDLKQFFHEQLVELRKIRFNLKKRLKETEEVTEKDQHRYYSAWFYSGIYVMLSIPKYQSIQAIARRLNLPEQLVAEVIHFLEGSGLIEKKAGTYRVTKKRLHLERESAFIQRHHINWRSQALQSAEKNLVEDMHFSSVIALSAKDFEEVKEVFLAAIEKARVIIKPSPEEEVMAITLDVFKL